MTKGTVTIVFTDETLYTYSQTSFRDHVRDEVKKHIQKYYGVVPGFEYDILETSFRPDEGYSHQVLVEFTINEDVGL